MKLPKTVTIYAVEYKIIKDPKSNGAGIDFKKATITIGTRKDGSVLNNFLHEIIEGILAENHYRYATWHQPADNGDYIFVFDHKEFENVITQIALAIKGIIKE